ncbi:MAG: hypothetical protein WAW69_04605, partial [Polaromonas sp.]
MSGIHIGFGEQMTTRLVAVKNMNVSSTRLDAISGLGSYGLVFWGALTFLVASRLTLILSLEVTPSSDAAWYYSRALEMLATSRYAEAGVATAYWPVGYPGFLAGLMALMGQTARVGQLANLMLSAACLVLMYRFCLQRFGDTRIAGAAAVLLAIYPNHMG